MPTKDIEVRITQCGEQAIGATMEMSNIQLGRPAHQEEKKRAVMASSKVKDQHQGSAKASAGKKSQTSAK
jgi:hypothetical protein